MGLLHDLARCFTGESLPSDTELYSGNSLESCIGNYFLLKSDTNAAKKASRFVTNVTRSEDPMSFIQQIAIIGILGETYQPHFASVYDFEQIQEEYGHPTNKEHLLDAWNKGHVTTLHPNDNGTYTIPIPLPSIVLTCPREDYNQTIYTLHVTKDLVITDGEFHDKTTEDICFKGYLTFTKQEGLRNTFTFSGK